ncbi:hypothetical protein MRX96_017102 [Rhipicephalus microplus]
MSANNVLAVAVTLDGMRGTFWHLSRKSRGRATRTPTGARSRQPNLKRLREARERSMHTTWAHPSYHTDRKTKVQCHLVHHNLLREAADEDTTSPLPSSFY